MQQSKNSPLEKRQNKFFFYIIIVGVGRCFFTKLQSLLSVLLSCVWKMMEMCLSGTVASGTRHVRLLDALERSCGGSGSDWDLLESTFACGQKEVKVRWTPGQNSMQIAQVTAPPRVTSRPEHSLPMEQVLCRPLSVVNDAGAEHLRGLEKKRRKRKRRKKKRRGG